MSHSDVILEFQDCGVNADLFPSMRLEVPTRTRGNARESRPSRTCCTERMIRIPDLPLEMTA